MNKKISSCFKITIIFIIFFCSVYSPGQALGATTSEKIILKTHYARAVRFYKQARYEQAVYEFQRVLEISPQHARAKKYLEAAKKKKDKNILNQFYKKASNYYKKREYQKALETYQEALEISPDDGYSEYNIEFLEDKIRRLKERKEKQQEKELGKLNKIIDKKNLITGKEMALELARTEREEQIAKEEQEIVDIRKKIDEMMNDGYIEKERALSRDIALEEVEKLISQEDRQISKLVESALSVQAEQKPSQLMAATPEQRLATIKLTYNIGKEYYLKKDYPRSIGTFQQVVSLEQGLKKRYTLSAKKYINKAQKILQKQRRKEKAKQIKTIEGEMIEGILKGQRAVEL